jgi:hypothetical protein
MPMKTMGNSHKRPVQHTDHWPHNNTEWMTNFPRFPCHTPRLPNEPPNDNEWDAWAERQLRTHRQEQCPICKLWHLWTLQTK